MGLYTSPIGAFLSERTIEERTRKVLGMQRHLVPPFQHPLNSRTRTDRIKLRGEQ